MNKVMLIGNLTRDPEAGTTANGVSYSRFSIAVSRRFSKEETDYFNIQCWKALADTCNRLLSKGKKVAIAGSIQIRNYESANGEKRTAVDIIADEVEFLSPKGDQKEYSAPSKNDDITKLTPVEAEELPF